MRIKAFFIMILALLAALFGAAQEAFVVYEGATTSHNVIAHPGSEFGWEMYKDFSPDIEAGPSEYEFVTPTNSNQVGVLWKMHGTFYLKVTETDATGCNNVKVLVVNVLPYKESTELFVSSDFVIGVENSLVSGDVSTNDFAFPYNNVEVKYSLVGDPPNGLQFNDNGTFVYQPSVIRPGKFYFSYQVCLESEPESCSETDVEIRILSDVPDENIYPIASPDVVLTFQETPVTSNVLTNDANFLRENAVQLTLSETPVIPPENGIVQILSDGTFTYTPNPGFTGLDKFKYKLCNDTEQLLCDSAWVYIHVNNFEHQDQLPPLSVSDDVIEYEENSVFSVAENDFSLDGQLLEYNTLPVVNTKHGILQIFKDGSFSYIPNPGFTGVDQFVYEVCGTEDPVSCRKSTAFILVTKETDRTLSVHAGKDTTIGNCGLYELLATVSDTAGITYLWEPASGLDDPTSATPIFTPGATTNFKVTVRNSDGEMATDSVLITVSEILADAGDDILIEKNTIAILDGSRSIGTNLQYFWYTDNGEIQSGENTATPIVSSSGVYYIEIRDLYDCVSTDSVEVSLITYAPIANDDYDTVSYQMSVNIPVLNNDYDADGDIDSTSLSILQTPVNGTVYVDFSDYTIVYTPDLGFIGNDVFEYRICDETEQCDAAHVFVVVNNFKFLIPNAFTPNGDNINDYFEILGIEYYENNSISIVNRWGNKVYEAKNYGIDTSPQFWDGKSNTGIVGGNEELPTGVYFYVLDLGNGQKPIAGSVYIDR